MNIKTLRKVGNNNGNFHVSKIQCEDNMKVMGTFVPHSFFRAHIVHLITFIILLVTLHHLNGPILHETKENY